MLSFLQMMEAKFEVRYYCTGDKTQTWEYFKGRSVKKKMSCNSTKEGPFGPRGGRTSSLLNPLVIGHMCLWCLSFSLRKLCIFRGCILPEVRDMSALMCSGACSSYLQSENVSSPGMTKNTSHTISIYGKMLVIHFPYNSIRTENCMKGL